MNSGVTCLRHLDDFIDDFVSHPSKVHKTCAKNSFGQLVKSNLSSPAVSYPQRCALCSDLPGNVQVSAKRVEVVLRS